MSCDTLFPISLCNEILGKFGKDRACPYPIKRALVMLNFDQSSLSSLIFFDVNVG